MYIQHDKIYIETTGESTTLTIPFSNTHHSTTSVIGSSATNTTHTADTLTSSRLRGNVKLQPFDGKSQSPMQWWTLFIQYCTLTGRPDADIVKYFPFHISQLVAEWYGTLAESVKSNLQELKEAFIQRYRKGNIEYTLTDIKQGPTELTEDYINRIIRESRDSGVPENILVWMMAGGLRSDLAGIVMPQTPKSIQHLRSIAAVADKTLAVTTNKPLEQLSAQVANLSQMEDRLMDALSSKLNAAVQSISTHRPSTSRPTHHKFGTPQHRRTFCNYCGRYCLNKESCPARRTEGEQVLLEPTPNLLKLNLMAARCTVSVNQGKSVIRVLNPTDKPIFFSRRMVLAKVEDFDPDSVQPLRVQAAAHVNVINESQPSRQNLKFTFL
ncbi:unnamed protein product [Mytilus edulis]|uniref:Uncharacterized protein n=1 Tax=Mytilus edulis TaxID=6550 RepID=A0A8S3QMD7_MYTED|nr:unnamed protein product [Mytilus edulis]